MSFILETIPGIADGTPGFLFDGATLPLDRDASVFTRMKITFPAPHPNKTNNGLYSPPSDNLSIRSDENHECRWEI